ACDGPTGEITMRWMFVCAITLLVAAAAPAQSLFPPPEQQRILRQEYLAAGRAYERDAMLEAYRGGDGQDERWDALVERFIDVYAGALAEEIPAQAEVAAAAQAVLESGCTDRGIAMVCA